MFKKKIMATKRFTILCVLCAIVVCLALITAILVPILVVVFTPEISHNKHNIKLPPHAVRSNNDPDLFLIEENGGMVEGVLRIRRNITENRTLGRDISDSCCGYIVPSAKLKEGMPYDLDIWAFDMDTSFVDATWMESMYAVNRAIGKKLFGPRRHSDFLGLSINGRNQIGAGHVDFGESNILAATLIWVRCSNPSVPVRSCPLRDREIFEWKQFYNIELFPWGNARKLGAAVYDLMSVFIHEILHCTNADDLKTRGCEDSTMWFSTAKGETKKRTIDAATVKCMRNLYDTLTGLPQPPPFSGIECMQGWLWW